MYHQAVNPITIPDFPVRRDTYLQALRTKLQGDARILAAWVEGSLGRGNADRYSDVDLHLLVEEADLAGFRAEAESWLSDVHTLVLYTSMFGGHMLNALTEDGVRIDVWPRAGDTIKLDPSRVLVLHERHGVITREVQSTPADAAALGRQVQAQLREFWRCVTLLPAVIGRSEYLVAFSGLAVELGLVTELLIAETGTLRDRGVKNLNDYLSAQDRAHLETVMLLPDLSSQTLVNAHLGLVRVVRERGPKVAEMLGVTYPSELETAALNYVREELLQLGLDVDRLVAIPL